MAASNLIQFKRGTSAALQTLITNRSGEDGCFYLTIDGANSTGAVKDSSRLYVGRADGSIVPVNQGITTVASTSELVDGVSNGDLHAGDFAYVSGDNIFAIYDGVRWIQINSVTDTYLDTFQVAITTTNGVATVTSQAGLNQTPKSGSQLKTDAFTITGDNGITISSEGKAITIAGDQYKLSSAAPVSNSTSIDLGHDTNFGASAGSISISSANADHLHITGNDNEIILDAPVTESVNIVAKASSANGFNVQSQDTFGNTSTATSFDPTVTYGGSGNQTVHFQNGNATLDVYTKSEVDAIKRTLDAMSYVGTVGTGGSAATYVSGITIAHRGDTYKVVGSDGVDLTTAQSSTGDAEHADAGDLLIAIGEEYTETDSETQSNPALIGTIKPSTLKFDIVPSGDDIDTYYEGTGITHGWQINKVRGAGDNLGALALAEGTAITLTDSGSGNNKIVTIGHGNVNVAEITAEGSDNVTKANGVSNTFTAVTGMTVNEQGHVTSVTTKTLTLAAEDGADLSAVTEAVSGTTTHSGVGISSVTITTTAQMTKNSGAVGTAQSDTFTLSSDNLTVSADAANKDAKINFTWGTF